MNLCCRHRTATAHSRSVGHLPALNWRGRRGGGDSSIVPSHISWTTRCCSSKPPFACTTHHYHHTHYFLWRHFTRFGGNVVCVEETALSTCTCIRVDSFCSVGLQFGLKLFSFSVSTNILNSPKVVFCILSFCLMHYFSNVCSVVILCLSLFFFNGLNIKTNCLSCRNGFNGVSAGFLDIFAQLYK